MKTKKKNLLLVILLIVLLAVAGGYALFSQTLTINGTANINAEWSVKITKIAEETLKDAKTKGDLAFTDTTATFAVDLEKPGATATYKVTVANEGSIDAVLKSVDGIDTANAAEPTGVTYTIDANQDDTLASKATKDYTVTVTWADTDTEIPDTKTKTATITLNYEQAQ